ncbi:hypothetical protein BGU79_00025 [Clostridioides difficile]|nr:hypothetical protein [Clostridioides difficile]PBG11392.1 hypothetical protein BGU79_00025 [Clostridioides difficile]
MGGCPVGIDIPGFITKIKEDEIEGAAKVIAKSSSLPAVCGRVCPQESQCEGVCIHLHIDFLVGILYHKQLVMNCS